MQERIPYIDFAAGIMILWVIIFHALGTAWSVELMQYRDIANPSALARVLSKLPFFKKGVGVGLPITEMLADCELSLPISPTMTLDEAKEVVRLINNWKI